jgi:S-adenosylmethionine hydrolase
VCLSDYGLEDEFVGVVHRVIEATVPGIRVIDLTHQIPPHDVRAGALTLRRAVPWLIPAVVLAVVDPGVGTSRRAVAMEAGLDLTLVGPDNGLLVPAAEAAGGIRAAVELSASRARPASSRDPRLGATFDGRDVFAPAAAAAAAGIPLTQLGISIDPLALREAPLPLPRRREGGVEAEVLWVDHFGNVQLNVTGADVDDLGQKVTVLVDGRPRPARRARAFADLEPGELGLITDSYGQLALVYDQAPAAVDLGLTVGSKVLLRR